MDDVIEPARAGVAHACAHVEASMGQSAEVERSPLSASLWSRRTSLAGRGGDGG